MKILTILARYGTDQYGDAESRIAGLFARQLPGVERTVVIVDNACAGDVIAEADHRVVIGGDNRSFEFSGFDRGVRWIGERLDQFDLIHFATSAFHTLYVAYLERFTTAVLRALDRRPVCLGHIDCYNDPIQLLGVTSQHWMRTGFFVLPPREVRLLGRFADIPDGSLLFSGDPTAPFRPDAPLSGNYQKYISDWLLGGDIGQGVTWHSSFGLTPETLPAFERKARCIATEQWLGIRLRALGCHMVDVTWLSGQLAKHPPDRVFWRAPWRSQLAGRDRDALVIP
jgi:hypothetical protein